ncbi:MAG: stretch-activated cation channel mid1 [Icmadophila ericetorum]|nr:stretch-activated cation channel mid1 [Icmadophila ericetorum]
MQFPKLTPLQSRFAASCAASLILVILYLAFSKPHFAYALDADSIEHSDHNHPLIIDLNDHGGGSQLLVFDEDESTQGYVPDFPSIGRSITGRAPNDPQQSPLANNVPGIGDISMGDAQYWVFPSSALYGPLSTETPRVPSARKRELGADEQDHLELKRRHQGDRTLYLTLNVCNQPSPVEGDPDHPPPQLKLFVSTNPSNQFPGDNSGTIQNPNPTVDGGWSEFQIETSSDVYIGIEAQTDSSFQGTYNYEITASIDDYYTFSEGSNFLQNIASDDRAGSLTFYTTNETSGTLFGMFVHNQGDVMMQAVSRSYCGMKNIALIQGNLGDGDRGNVSVLGSQTIPGAPIQQFFVDGLNSSSSYVAFMAIASNYSSAGSGNVNGGGTIWQSVQFNTTNDINCRVIYNISTCPGFSYKVPANSNNSTADLISFYNNMTFTNFQPFKYALQQIPCDTEDSAQYSLAANCTDCMVNYTRWFCTVQMPMCESIFINGTSSHARNVNSPFPDNTSLSSDFLASLPQKNAVKSLNFNRSRNTDIDGGIAPGPYNEILPCPDLCYGLVRGCSSAMGFSCPLTTPLLWYSYGEDPATCNNAGIPSGSSVLRVPSMVLLYGVVGVFMII